MPSVRRLSILPPDGRHYRLPECAFMLIDITVSLPRRLIRQAKREISKMRRRAHWRFATLFFFFFDIFIIIYAYIRRLSLPPSSITPVMPRAIRCYGSCCRVCH